jgi:hypothetical protein
MAQCRQCGSQIPDGEQFCDPLCYDEYYNQQCIDCGEIKTNMHTLTEPKEFLGKKICYGCFEERKC